MKAQELCDTIIMYQKTCFFTNAYANKSILKSREKEDKMHRLSEQFAKYCEKNFNLSNKAIYEYQSLSVCIIDCIYSLRAKYESTTIPVVDRYAAMYMEGDRNKPGDTVSDLICHIDASGGPDGFARSVLMNRQLSGRVLKAEVCLQLAKYLKAIGIETVSDFQNFKEQELLEVIVHSVKGLGDAGTNYLFMLTGDPNRCKPDVHIHHCIRDACGEDVSNDECQVIICEATNQLRAAYPKLTARDLDSIIWHVYQAKKNKE